MLPPLTAIKSRFVHGRAMKNSVFGVAVRALAGFSRIGVLLLVARYYGPAPFGRVALAMSLVEIFRTFSEFGLDTVALRRFSHANAESERSQIFSRVLTTKLVLASIFYVSCLVATSLLSHNRLELQFAAIASISLFSANLVGALVAYYQSQLRMHEIFWVTLFVQIAYVLISVSLILARAPLPLVLGILPAAEFAYFLLLRSREHLTSQLVMDSQGTLGLLRESLPLGIMSGMILLYLRIDNVILYKLAGSSALGLYAACFRMIEPVLMIPGAFSVSLLALLSAKSHDSIGRSEIWGLCTRTLWPAYLFVLCAAAGLILLGKTLLAHFSPDYVVAYPALCILSLCLLVRTLNITMTTVITSRGAYSTLAKLAAVNLAINVGLVVVLVPTLGMPGAAWAAFGTESVNMAMQFMILRSVTRTPSEQPIYEIVNLEPNCE
jgi:polysaccharide transporter, PST family